MRTDNIRKVILPASRGFNHMLYLLRHNFDEEVSTGSTRLLILPACDVPGTQSVLLATDAKNIMHLRFVAQLSAVR